MTSHEPGERKHVNRIEDQEDREETYQDTAKASGLHIVGRFLIPFFGRAKIGVSGFKIKAICGCFQGFGWSAGLIF